MSAIKIILYYGFTPLKDPNAVVLWQRALCASLNLKGRIVVSEHGINGALAGKVADLKIYVRSTKQYPGFSNIKFNWSDGRGDEFEKLSVKPKKELVTFGTPAELLISKARIQNGGTHLLPHQVNQLVAERGEDVVFFDGRNAFEAQIGRFKNAVVPDVQTTREFIAELESGKYDHLKQKPIVTYCTGGIRCEILSAVMIDRGFQEVYQISGGIMSYGEKYKDSGLWEGSLYVFDKRMSINFSKTAKTIGRCQECSFPTSIFHACLRLGCRDLILLCSPCSKNPQNLGCSDSHTRGRSQKNPVK